MYKKGKLSVLLLSFVATAVALVGGTGLVHAGAREDACLLTATEVLQEVEGMPDQRLPDLLLQRAYGIAVIPDVARESWSYATP